MTQPDDGTGVPWNPASRADPAILIAIAAARSPDLGSWHSMDREDAVFNICALWRNALAGGRHVPLRQRWPELAQALDALLDTC